MRNLQSLSYLVYVDDDEDDRSLFQETIEELFPNIDLRLYENGKEFIEDLVRDISNLPRLVFMDLNMPIKNGFECLEEIRLNNTFRQIPIAVYSTSSCPRDKNRSLQLGAKHFITKPTSFSEMKALISNTVQAYLD